MSGASKEPRSKPEFLAVDFFCGAGGTTRGLIDAGGYVIAGIDNNARCRSTYVDNNINESVDYAAARFLEFDIFSATEEYPRGQKEQLATELDGLLSYYRTKARDVPLLFAICAPCQPFTRLARKELSEKRKRGRERDSNLLREAAGFVERFRPEMVLSENVSGIGDAKYGDVWNEFRTNLEALGYVTGSQIVCTSKFGIPQYRKRSILIAIRRELVRTENLSDMLGSELLVPEADPNSTYLSVAKAIGHLPPISAGETHPVIPNHRARSLSDLNLKRLSSALPGAIKRLYVLDGTRGSQPRVPSASERTAGRPMLFGRLYSDAAEQPVTHDHDEMSLDLEWPFRTLRRRPSARHISSRGRHLAIVSGELRLSPDRPNRTCRAHDRERCAAQACVLLCRVFGQVSRTNCEELRRKSTCSISA